jgi:OPT family oligopeptide transporter
MSSSTARTDQPGHNSLAALPVLSAHSAEAQPNTEIGYDRGTRGQEPQTPIKEEEDSGIEKLPSEEYLNEKSLIKEDDALYVKGEPVITSGRDVSRFVVDLRDDGDEALTLRSLVLGTIWAGLGAALYQIYLFKPVQMVVSSVFLLLIVYTSGQLWYKLMPRKSWVEGTRWERFGWILHIINPGKFTLKEHVVSTLIASTAAYGSASVANFAVQRLYYDTNVGPLTAVFATFSTAMFGYAIVGVLRPLTVYPSEMVYWGNLPTVSIFQALHAETNTTANARRLKLFWTVFAALFVWEIFPSYIFPLLGGFSVFCLASQKAPSRTRDIMTNVFGGAQANEGLGLLSISLDWQYIGSTYMSFPLTQQANSWVGYFLCYIAILAIYYSDTWSSKSFPMLSTSIFSANGSVYHQSAVFDSQFRLNETALDVVGLPHLTGSNAWHNLTLNLSIGALIAHVLLFWRADAVDAFKQARAGSQPDPHYQAMQKYKEAPTWWYHILMVLAFLAGLVVCIKGETTLPAWSYVIALLLGAFVTPFSTMLYARVGNGVGTSQLFKMVAGAVNPGRPVANLYFSMWSHDVVSQSIGLAGDLKMAQYLKIPPRVMFLTQVWGALLGAIVNYVVMVSIVTSQREVLLDPVGTNVWSGQYVQSLNSQAVTWSLAKQLYGVNGAYFLVPMGLVIGFGPTTIQYFVAKRWKSIAGVPVESIILPLIYMYAGWFSSGVTSITTTLVATGVVTQVWLRRYHPGWYRKYNYILGGAMDGGAQVMIFLLSFAVFGASGKERPFPSWAGNPARGRVDYCNGNGAFDD